LASNTLAFRDNKTKTYKEGDVLKRFLWRVRCNIFVSNCYPRQK
jgi:hypothetical protein